MTSCLLVATKTGRILLLGLAVVIASHAQTFTSLHSFDRNDGQFPMASLVQGRNGDFYGTAFKGGNVGECSEGFGCGMVYQITSDGALQTLYNFDGTAGEYPEAALIQTHNGNLYGTASSSGNFGGTVFKISDSGQATPLYSFCALSNCIDGKNPYSALVEAPLGFYGTTSVGGANCLTNGAEGCGTVFKISTSGQLTTLYSFCAQTNCIDGSYPENTLVLANDGSVYGTTDGGGTNGGGTVFKISPAGNLITVYNFCSQASCTDGYGGTTLVQAANGNFYGTTWGGGAYGYGTVFELTPTGKLATLYSFCSEPNCTDGANPNPGLIQATDGHLYGTTFHGGAIKAESCSRSPQPARLAQFTASVRSRDARTAITHLRAFCKPLTELSTGQPPTVELLLPVTLAVVPFSRCR